MNVSRLTFTKETKEQMEKGINHFRKGELRWNKLKELEESGKLSKATGRQDITDMLGLGRGYGAGYTWVSNMISKGHIKEVLLGFDSTKKPEYEYHLVSKPDYNPQGKAGISRKANAKNKASNTAEVKTTDIKPTSNGTLKAVIRYKELTIEIESLDSKVIENIVNELVER